MTVEGLAKLVREMRKKQKEYFRYRHATVLQESKDLERRVDIAVEEVLDRQEKLFD